MKYVLVILFFAIAMVGYGQNRILEYRIQRKGDVVGLMTYTESHTAQVTTRKVKFDVELRMLISFVAQAIEESVFENGIMTWSSLYRKMNGKEKANKLTKLIGTQYIVQKGSRKEVLNIYPITYNLLCMYTEEPVNVSRVYSDNFQKFCTIQKVAAEHYRVRMPDGNSTEYFYKNGVCVQMHIHHTLYEVRIELMR